MISDYFNLPISNIKHKILDNNIIKDLEFIENINNEFCKGNQKFYGIGFFYPKNEIEIFNNIVLFSSMI